MILTNLKSVHIHQDDLLCPQCNKLIDGQASPNGATPKRNDISVCLYCGSVNIFSSDNGRLKLTKASKEFLSELKRDYPDTYAKIQAYSKAIAVKNELRSKRHS